ncbi:CapA family protein [Corynebacterium sp. TAE3-ERU12]|uniref:CapA family protein n=1 Tax=Corynebacterium sp. TAE3-ERU12 TaxID=2849491 RepID=UPI001C47168B|nr:CapA family protein [Corynebacterium sp. TAE3-ERU12]MBV7295000.1 CapA family protein [Corynebacterium sp. TAE3-ERU12]
MSKQSRQHQVRQQHRTGVHPSLLRATLVGTVLGGLGAAAALSTPSLGAMETLGLARNPDSAAQSQPQQPTTTVTVTGDLLWHEPVWESAMTENGGWDFTPVFGPMSDFISGADLSICHEEVMFAPWEGPFTGYPQFQAPPQIAQGVAEAGWDLCTTASNHSVDGGFPSIERTLNAFDEAGVLHVGTARSPEEAAQPVIYTTDDGVRIGVVAGTYGTNGLPVPQPWMVQDLDVDELLAKAAATREAGADIVMVAMHAGGEGMTEPDGQQLWLADALTRSPDVDVVYGHSSHAVQPIEKVNGKWVVYGLGNLVAAQTKDNYLAYEGLAVEFSFVPDGDGYRVKQLKYVPTVISAHGERPVRATPISDLLGTPGADDDRLRAVLNRTRDTVRSRGADMEAEFVEG